MAAKHYSKLCRAYHTFFEGYQVPVGACYGRILVCGEEWFWTCTDYSGIKTGQLHINFMKRQWLSNQDCHIAKMTWHTINVSKNHVIYKEVLVLLKSIGGIPKVTQYEPPRNRIKISASEHREIAATVGRKNAQRDFNLRGGRPQGGDNADKGAVISNQHSYWAIKKDMMRNVCNYGGDIYGRP